MDLEVPSPTGFILQNVLLKVFHFFLSPLCFSFLPATKEQKNKTRTNRYSKSEKATHHSILLLTLDFFSLLTHNVDPLLALPGTSLAFVACLQMKKCYWGSTEPLLSGQIHFPTVFVGWRGSSRQEVTSLSPLWSSKAPGAICWFMLLPRSWCLCFKWSEELPARLCSWGVFLAFFESLPGYCCNTPASKANGRCRSAPSNR